MAIQKSSSSESLFPELARTTLDEKLAINQTGKPPGWIPAKIGGNVRTRVWAVDGARVMFKRVRLSEYPDEVEIAQTLSSEQYTSDPRNHSVPFLEVLEVPGLDDTRILVMPLLYPYNYPVFKTIGEVIDYLRQIIEVRFLSPRNVKDQRDYKLNNTMAASLDLYSQPPHPFSTTHNYDFSGIPEQRSTRTETPINYHVIDFGLSRKYASKEGNLEAPPWGGYSGFVPEFKTRKPCDPFPVDVFYLGYLIRSHFVVGTETEGPMRGMKFLDQLTLDMTANNPKARPPIDEVRDRFERLVKSLSWMELRSPALYPKHQQWTLARSMAHWKKQLHFTLRRVPAIPSAPSAKT
ncbi:hypothetical protein NLJ89_g636 [Agrocybe chaxingu]|uniref:Protein kinase domain-containing protein n=1 Tax=Agrocybe chaxingu TaxID=84603 RepID=A0A9W8TFS8_9AGAR|nr:hypothetical protein NLJ89_g636 [Agrocybe chaxingu]